MDGDRGFIRLHVEALFTTDRTGRLIAVNERGGAPAPRFFLGRSEEGSVAWFRHDLEDDLVSELEALSKSTGARIDVEPGEAELKPFLDCLARRGALQRTWTGPAYRFPDALSPHEGTVVLVPGKVDVLRPYLVDWMGDVLEGVPAAASLEDGRAVSICCSVRTTAEADEAGVETHPQFRGRGHASAATMAWARAVRDMGRVPLYSTSWANVASRALASRLGLVQFGADLHIT